MINRKWTPEIWGGVECTVNRVGDRFFNQLQRSGHWGRISDLDHFASLGIRTLRYPALWELVCPSGNIEDADWAWTDERLKRLRELKIRPIVGLVHHGSGPKKTNLLDPGFSDGLAEYARAFAERYPWVEDYTPINEPLTTARFSALYGVWYPHAKDFASFLKALISQCRAVVLSMKEVRKVNPSARLIQTEDLGKITGTRPVAYQVAFENMRRWWGLDLLFGRVNRGHPYYELLRLNVGEKALDFFVQSSCPPDVIGLNYYITSDRFLDHRVRNYPPELHGGNGQDVYVDIESVRVKDSGIAGHEKCLVSAWERYETPLAITEVHIDSTREDQLRWVAEAWNAAQKAKKKGVDVRAITIWALLGSFDWDMLVTRENGHYESGVFDLHSSPPRATALAEMVKGLVFEKEYKHPVLESYGWWRRPCRFTKQGPEINKPCEFLFDYNKKHPILIAGGNGTLGRAFAKACGSRALAYQHLTRKEMDIADPQSVQNAISRIRPWAVINAAGYTKVDEAECQSEICYRENTLGAEVMAMACRKKNLPFLTFSTDLVFDGKKNFYVETDPVSPLNVYGQSKAEAEKLVLNAWAGSFIVRTSAFFGPWDNYNFLAQTLMKWAGGEAVSAAHDIRITPTYVPDLVRVCLDMLIDGTRGIWHLTNHESVSWAEFAMRLAEKAGFSPDLVKACESASLGYFAPRPKCSALATERGIMMPSLESALDRYLLGCDSA